MQTKAPQIQPEILFEDADLAVIAKPSGSVVTTAASVPVGSTIQEWWRARLETASSTAQSAAISQGWSGLLPEDFTDEWGSPEEIFTQRNGIVHRLDKETSGCLLLAKNPGSLVNLLAQFKQRQVHKEYTALLHGKITPKAGEINLPLARNPGNYQRMAVVPSGRKATTTYQVQTVFAGLAPSRVAAEPELQRARDLYQGFSLVSCIPKTGRMHQLRVHFTHQGHPLVADSKYAGRKRARKDLLWCPRLFLHASLLSFTHPRTRAPLSITCPLTQDLQAALAYLE